MGSPFVIRPYLEALLCGEELSPAAAEEVARAVLSGRLEPVCVAALLAALRAKGETAGEIAAFARALRAAALRVNAPAGTLDTCGTGGDKSGTFNISTAAAFVSAGMGIPVAKHGGRSVSSNTGSADVLKSLGVNLDAGAETAGRCIREAGIGFLFAPAHHPGMKYVAPVRKELGVRTIFNVLGPLSNPAGAKRQLLGVFDPVWCEKLAAVLRELGSEAALVVCGAGPGGRGWLDEVSTFGPTTLARLADGKISVLTVTPQELGIEPPPENALLAENAGESAAIIRAVLNGRKGAARDIVLANAAAAARVAGLASDWAHALQLAAASIDSGRALRCLEALVRLTHEDAH